MDTTGEKEKRTSKKNVDRRSTSSHDNKKFGTRSMEKQKGMAFVFRKNTTAVIKPDRWMDYYYYYYYYHHCLLYAGYPYTYSRYKPCP